MRPLPALQSAMVIQNQFIPGPELMGSDPFGFNDVAGFAPDPAHQMFGRQSQGMAFTGLQAQDGLAPGGKESFGDGGVGLSVDHGRETTAHQIAHLPGAIACHHPGVGGHTRIGAGNRLAVR